ncbi:MAG: hypothetical protein B9S34_13565 [Opitutia bacterium Tous-C1TDCM]|nr:MAG: hypothetical protein B9S34_13565 [Opitutae bacterium Tous-C1TDCM]
MPRLFRRALAGLIFSLLVPVLSAAWTAPAGPELARLERALADWHRNYNPAEQMVRRPFSSPGYHTALKGGFVHATRDNANYALGLLDTGKPENLERAVAVLRRIVALQDSDPASRTYGIWSWFLEEPLAQMSPPDFNWADFNGVTLLQVARDHRNRLPPDLAAGVDAAILHACRAIKKRNVGPGYTNIAIMGAYVTLVAGEFYGLEEFRAYGLERLARFHRHTADNGAFEEYNSPTYTVIALLELSRLKAHVRAPAAQALIDPLLRQAWETFARRFHAPSRQWAGPNSRAYSSLIRTSALALVQRGTAGRVDFGVDAPDREDLRLPVACPPDLEPFFTRLDTARTVVETFIRRSDTVGTTYLHPHYALGTVNRGDLWNQRRALLLHFGTAAAPGYVQLRVLKNGYDFSSAIFHSAQREGTVAGAVDFIVNGGDTHISLDKVKEGKIRARDLRLRFEVGGPAAAAAKVDAADGRSATIKAGDLVVSLALAHARFAGRDAVFTAGGDATTRWLDVVLYAGEETTLDLNTVADAAVAFALNVGSPVRAAATTADGRVTVTAGDLAASAALRPYARK